MQGGQRCRRVVTGIKCDPSIQIVLGTESEAILHQLAERFPLSWQALKGDLESSYTDPFLRRTRKAARFWDFTLWTREQRFLDRLTSPGDSGSHNSDSSLRFVGASRITDAKRQPAG